MDSKYDDVTKPTPLLIRLIPEESKPFKLFTFKRVVDIFEIVQSNWFKFGTGYKK